MNDITKINIKNLIIDLDKIIDKKFDVLNGYEITRLRQIANKLEEDN